MFGSFEIDAGSLEFNPTLTIYRTISCASTTPSCIADGAPRYLCRSTWTAQKTTADVVCQYSKARDSDCSRRLFHRSRLGDEQLGTRSQANAVVVKTVSVSDVRGNWPSLADELAGHACGSSDVDLAPKTANKSEWLRAITGKPEPSELFKATHLRFDKLRFSPFRPAHVPQDLVTSRPALRQRRDPPRPSCRYIQTDIWVRFQKMRGNGAGTSAPTARTARRMRLRAEKEGSRRS